jgi:nucleoside-diphosphate-sugar epimerase
LSRNTSCTNVFITGGSGCVGQYLLDLLVEDERYRCWLLLRNPGKLTPAIRDHPRVTVIEGSLADRHAWYGPLQHSDILIHMATSWDGNQNAFVVNVDQALALMGAVNRERCRKILYFSTGSILDTDNRPLEFAKVEGTDYIRSKYACYERLGELDVRDRITVLFPSLILGASKDKPVSHVSSGIPRIARWLGVIRFFKADGSFHYIHAHDIALIAHYLLEHECGSRELLLGNPAITFNECIEQLCAYFGKKILWRFELTPPLVQSIIKLFRIQMSPWDYYYIKQRHFRYKRIFNPATFGLKTPFGTLTGILAER